MPPQPPYPPQQGQPGQPGPSSALKFTVQGSVLTSNLVPPTLTIDGFPAPAATGSTVIPIQPGQHHLEVYSQWLRRYGQAALDVQVPPNAMVEVFYAPPLHQFTTGDLGFTPQQRKGIGCFVTLLLVLVVFVILVVLLAVFGS
jgi:hypothetical protein